MPLKVYWEKDLRPSGHGKTFLPGATCLGDVLRAQGYRNVFLGGAPLSFAGKGRFLRDHGYEETWGREEWERAGVKPGELNAWGMYDSALFERARAALDRLHAGKQPFNLTLLTLDTHQPFGFLSNSCRQRGAANFQGIVSCASQQIAEFIAFAQARGYLEDTTIVVIGDHLAYPNPIYDRLQKAGDRRGMFNLFIGRDLPKANTAELLPFDLFPTLLELVGVRVNGDRLGLGYSAVGEPEAVRPQGWTERWSKVVVRSSARYDQLWRGAPQGADAGH